MNTEIFAVLGGDLRQIQTAKGLAESGYKVKLFGFDNYSHKTEGVEASENLSSSLDEAKYIVLPLPYTTDGENLNAPYISYSVKLGDIFSQIKSGCTVFGGKISGKETENLGIKAIDYFEREELQIMNAVPTAEGAISIAMAERPYTVAGSKCLIVGFGRIGKILSEILKGLNADVTVSSRKYSDEAWIKAFGYTPIKTDKIIETADKYDIVFNTVPSLIINRSILELMKKDALIIDLASKPGGIDFNESKELGIKTVWALSLPGKVAPVSAGNFIKDTILNIIKEENS